MLAMTSEALHPEGDRAETGRKFAGIPPTPEMTGQLGSQTAIWNSIKTAAAKESQANCEQVAPAARAVEPEAIEPEAMEPGFTPTEVGRRAILNAQAKSSGEIARIEPSQIVAVPSAEAPRDSRKSRPAIKEQCYRVFRNPLSTVVALLVFAVVYRGVLPLTTSAGAGSKVIDYRRSDPDSTNSFLTVSTSPGRTVHRSNPSRILSPAEPQAVERARRHLSDDDSVAQDFTNHLASPAQSSATRQNPELKPSQGTAKKKRIVVD